MNFIGSKFWTEKKTNTKTLIQMMIDWLRSHGTVFISKKPVFPMISVKNEIKTFLDEKSKKKNWSEKKSMDFCLNLDTNIHAKCDKVKCALTTFKIIYFVTYSQANIVRAYFHSMAMKYETKMMMMMIIVCLSRQQKRIHK